MALKDAALLAFVGALLATAYLIWILVFDISNSLRGLIAAARLFPAVIETFASLTATIFFFVFWRKG